MVGQMHPQLIYHLDLGVLTTGGKLDGGNELRKREIISNSNNNVAAVIS